MQGSKMMKMKRSAHAENILAQINDDIKLGDIRKLAKSIKKDHDLALDLWSTGKLKPRLLAILIFDKKLLSEELIDQLVEDMSIHAFDARNQLMDWLMANQLVKDKKKIALIESWQNSPFALQRRTFWYYQGRQRWTGQTPPDNTEDLVSTIEANIAEEKPEVQWAMNFTAGWIGVYDAQYRERCITIGERTGLYRGEMVSKGCTPNYLPEFISIEANKRNL